MSNKISPRKRVEIRKQLGYEIFEREMGHVDNGLNREEAFQWIEHLSSMASNETSSLSRLALQEFEDTLADIK